MKDNREKKALPRKAPEDSGLPPGEAPPSEEEERKKPAVLMAFDADYALSGEDGAEAAGGQARAQLDEEALSVLPRSGEALQIPLRHISRITRPGYSIELSLTSREKLTLSKLGRGLEDLFRETSRLRNEMLLRDMLMHETVVKAGATADCVCRDAAGGIREEGPCEARLYQTALVVITEGGGLHRLPYSDIARVREKPYAVALDTESGESFTFSRMGRELDPWKRALGEATNALTVKVQSWVQELMPAADPATVRKIARLMKEGRAARRLDIEAASPDLWPRLEKKLAAMGLADSYAFLRRLAREERMCIGLKRGLLGDLTGEYLWFLAPIYGTGPGQPGNAIAMEAASASEREGGDGEEGVDEGPAGPGMATYVFRMAAPAEYAALKTREELDAAADQAIARINHCLAAINFRREPVYLTDEQMREPRYARYQFAVQRIPQLRELRSLFIGRVVHSSPEQWQQGVRALLARAR